MCLGDLTFDIPLNDSSISHKTEYLWYVKVDVNSMTHLVSSSTVESLTLKYHRFQIDVIFFFIFSLYARHCEGRVGMSDIV